MCVAGAAHADKAQPNRLDLALASELLEASKSDQSISKHDKLFTKRCEVIDKYLPPTSTPIGKAMVYSCTAPAVGVAFYAGKDLGQHSPDKIAKYIEASFAKNGMLAKVFIESEHRHGSSVAMMMNGGSHLYNPMNPLEAIKNIESFAAEAKLIYFTDKKISPKELEKWVKSEIAYLPETG